MRGSYPVAASNENWLHESLVEMIRTIHDKLDQKKTVPSWSKLIPSALGKDNSSRLKNFSGIKDRLKIYESEVKPLSIAQRAEIYQELIRQNDLNGLLDGTVPLPILKTSFPTVYKVVHDLFVFAFDSLTDLGIRDRQYSLIFRSLSVKVCIFCGFERVMSPQEARQDQDHYLPKSIYPFAAANMKNLVPMCRCCNRDYKHDIDVLTDCNGDRRKAFDPYDAPLTDISLVRSIPFAGLGLRLPAWWIDFQPDTEETETWDQVFCIRTRYSRDLLNEGFNRWIESFMNHCKAKRYSKDLDDNQILNALESYHRYTIIENPVGLDFLKPKVFEMLIYHFVDNNERVKMFVKDMVCGISVNS
ncbi:hypothetical protein [Vogesella mureinivorans]|uniref:hypothetical protein n=1 Tax=Vogesella mureinivorans TaxID=657276 RepID=UPI0011CB21C2|nr:hypothetical protein [Vogesella mureinivorans]